MTPVHQLFRQELDQNVYGDCLRAVIASMLDLPAAEVPHFAQPGGPGTAIARPRDLWAHVDYFLEKRNLALFGIPFPGDEKLGTILARVGASNPGKHWLLCGASILGNHIVICKNDEIIHDPSPDERDPILVGPMEEGWWWVYLIVMK